ncbi:hypothetical protein ACH44C_07330 [Streptomyces purpureus]|uniref:hypothetical protein n=1 Tax=Streptomyces purpureus TaxID=1951 RepID=UPI003791F766
MDAPLPATTNWLLRGKDGRLTAYAPVEGGVLRWTETTPGGPEWAATFLPAHGLVPYLSITQSPEGYVYLTGLRRRPGADGQLNVDIVYGVQYQSGRPMRDWHALGTPYLTPRNRHHAANIGLPVSALDSAGALHIAIRNAGGGLCARSQAPTGRWLSKWADLKGSNVTGTVAATVNEDGNVDLYGPTGTTVLRWSQPKPGAEFARGEDQAAEVADGTFTAVRTGKESVTRFWRDAGTGEVRTWRPGTAPRTLGGASGTGPVSLLRTPVDGVDCVLLAQRDATGRPALTAYPAEREETGADWSRTGDVCVGVPALAIDARGRVVLAAIGTDGTLRVTRQKDESGLALDAWTRV